MAIRLSRQERAAGAGRGASRLPPLSPAFVHEADAAYWAHRKIGDRRDREYGGVILKNPAGKYFATDPVPGDGMQFDLLNVLGISAQGYYQQPRGYTCVASYHSHPAQHALIRERNPSFDERMAKAFLGFFSGSDFSHDVDDREFFPAAYLSGPDGSLIRYAPSGSSPERSFALWLRAGKPAGSRVGVYGPFNEFVKKVSTLGELSLIVPTALWGGSFGKVPANWVVFEPFSSSTLTELPLFTAVFDQATKAIRSALAGGGAGGVLLKARDKEAYIATVGRTLDPHQPFLRQLFPNREGKFALPADYGVAGFYLGPTPPATVLPVQEPELYQAFFAPRALALGIYQAHTLETVDQALGVSIYYRTQGRALLKYRCSLNSAEAALFKVEADGSVVDDGLDVALLSGQMSPRDFVRRVASTGQLSVEQTSALWSVAGVVDENWVPDKTVTQPTSTTTPGSGGTSVTLPALSPAFIHADDAALWAHRRIGARRDREYGGVILRNLQGYFFATEPVSGQGLEFDIRDVLGTREDGSFLPIAGYRRAGLYHSHPADYEQVASANPKMSEHQVKVYLNFFSPWDAAGDITYQHNFALSYLSGPDDSLVRYRPSGSFAEAQYANWILGKVSEAAWGTDGSIEGHVKKMLAVGELSFVTSNPLWGGSRGGFRRTGSPIRRSLRQRRGCCRCCPTSAPRSAMPFKRAWRSAPAPGRPGALGWSSSAMARMNSSRPRPTSSTSHAFM